MKLFDKTGREIQPGDVLKVFHYIAARRRKRCYMYKQALAYDDRGYLRISHLNRIDDSEMWEIGKNYYLEYADDRALSGVEIVDSVDANFEDRPRKITAQAKAQRKAG